MRKVMMILAAVQVFSSIIGFITYFARRNRLILFINFFDFILSIFGFFGAMKYNVFLSLAHWILTSGFVGSFFIYELISALFIKDQNLSEPHITETWMLLLFSLPYLIDLIVGIYGTFFANFLIDWQKKKNSEDEDALNEELIRYQRNTNETDFCCICMVSRKDWVFYPWGHESTCYEWGHDYFTSKLYNQRKCIICRQQINNVIRVYH